jgi:hemerythrin superfamily protein
LLLRRRAGAASFGAKGQEMDIWQAIRDDHGAFDALFEKIADSEQNDERARLIAELRAALEAHAQGEERAVYPVLEKIGPLEDAIASARKDYETIRRLLTEIVMADDDDQTDLLADLEEAVQDHAEEEEESIIAVAEQLLDEEQARQMLRRFEAAKKAAARS